MTREQVFRNYADNHFMQYCGIELVEDRSGALGTRVQLSERHFNANEHVHGGLLFSMADATCGANARLYADKVTTLNSDFHYLRSHPARCLYASCELLRDGGRTLVFRAQVKGDAGEVFAEGTFTFYKL